MSSSESELDSSTHTAALKRLKTNDPEFYQFLKENDENLLNYNDSDEEEKEMDADNSGNESEDAEEVSSSEIEDLKLELQNSPSLQSCKKVMSLLKTSLARASNAEQHLTIVDGGLFNDVMRLCLVELLPALGKVLKLPTHSDASLNPSKSKSWKKLVSPVKSYLIDMLKIISFISERTTLVLILKHVMRLVPYYIQFIKLSRILMKKMIHVWSTSEEEVRVLAFVTIYRIMKRLPNEYHSQVLKQMYFAFVRNTKFTTPTSLPLINFMKRSLTELYASHSEIAYEHTFLYLRQLCIHLRNAVTTKKKECYQTVYNWQFIHCIVFWADVIAQLYDFEPVKTLVYPLVQLTIGTLNLIPTIKYVPLRFHLVKVLIGISSSTKVFIPVPPLILEALNLIDTDKKLAFSKKPINMACALKASKSQLQESGYRDTIIAEVCKLLTEYFAIYACSISFPELAFLAITQLKSFLKKNKVAKYGHQLKSVLDKLQQNSNYISQQRNCVSFEMTDLDKVKQWEDNLLQQGTPFLKEVDKCVNTLSHEPPQKKLKCK